MPKAADTARRGPGPRRAAHALLRWCLRAERRDTLAAIGLAALWQLALVSIPWSVQRALDDGVAAADRGALLTWSAVVAATGLFAWLAQRLGQHLNYLAGARVVARLRARLSAHLLSLDTRAIGAYGRGDLHARNTHDIDLVWMWVSGTVDLPQLLIGIAGVVVAVAVLDPLLSVLCLAAVAAITALNAVFGRLLGARSAELAAAHSARADTVDELVTGGATVRGLGGESALVEAHHARSAAVAAKALAVGGVGANWSALSSFTPLAAIAAGLALGAPAVLDGTMSIGGLTAFVTWMLMLTATSTTLSVRLSQRAQAAEAATRIAEVLSTPAAVTEHPRPAPVAHGPLHCRDVVVEHGARRVLGPLGLTVPPGETVLLTGPVAAGKSTLLRLLVRLDDPASGTVTYGGADLTTLRLDDLRRRIALVPQRPLLVSGTVAENLTLGLPGGATADEMRAACRAAAVEEEIDALPSGFDTPVGEGGATFSGGQRRRLALARALLRRPDVLLLDDVTSAVDTPTEERMLAGIRAWSPGATVIVVGDRPAVRRFADRVVEIGPASAGPASAGLLAATGDAHG
ncbi:ATP-binding cassette, subfamily B [Sinosporangium album]|uniref:ATP-binding cassette, subfamily B n=1 Tax=Sinosporangium album TaxID=504805 RepID=A0A1G7ZQD4_9ACTN|nr:ABC transporter ATP-binding protein [Sinosporangium album]SDH10914.1 ATP-binding cassette, subfamily B [Sinosporangium album]